jgi:hypothetical protein
MPFITESSQVETNYTEIKELATRRFLEKLRELGRDCWAYTEETGETNIKPFAGWQ